MHGPMNVKSVETIFIGCQIDTVKLICEFWQMVFVNPPKCLNQVNCVNGELNKKIKIKIFFLDAVLTRL
jgi:protein tyrosine phosphatase